MKRTAVILFCLVAFVATACLPDEPAAPPDCTSATCDTCPSYDTIEPDCPAANCDTCPEPIDTIQPEDTIDTIDTFDTIDTDVGPICEGAPDCPTLGVCACTVQPVCTEDGWICDTDAVPSYEPDGETICDGLDNDCDGEIDEDLVPPDDTCPDEGVCKNLALPVCQPTGWTCIFTAVPDYEEVETLCDDRDNDCDGEVDNGEIEGTPLCETCKPGSPTCFENNVAICDPTGTTWLPYLTCPEGTYCMGLGGCTPTDLFQVNVTTDDDQNGSTIVRTDDAQYLVAWQSDSQDTSNLGVFHQTFTAEGSALNEEDMPGNTYTNESQAAPTAAPLLGGGALLAWASKTQFHPSYSIISRVIGPELAFGEVPLSTDLDNSSINPAATRAGDRIAVVWEGGSPLDRAIYLRLVDANTGLPLDAPINITEDLPSQDTTPDVATLDDQTVVVVWAADNEIWGRVVGAEEIEPPVELFSNPAKFLQNPKIAINGESILVAWEELNGEICSHIYTPQLLGFGTTYCIPTPAPLVTDFAIAPDGLDGFVILWHDRQTDPPVIRMQHLDLAGLFQADHFIKSSGDQYQLTEDTDISVHSTTGGKLLITWSGTQTGGSGLDVFGKFVSLP